MAHKDHTVEEPVGYTVKLSRGRPPSQFQTPEDFWANVEKGPLPDDCWNWRGKPNVDGYAYLQYRRVTVIAHRLAFQLAFPRSLRKESKVRQTCHNKLCCNPAHLVQSGGLRAAGGEVVTCPACNHTFQV